MAFEGNKKYFILKKGEQPVKISDPDLVKQSVFKEPSNNLLILTTATRNHSTIITNILARMRKM